MEREELNVYAVNVGGCAGCEGEFEAFEAGEAAIGEAGKFHGDVEML